MCFNELEIKASFRALPAAACGCIRVLAGQVSMYSLALKTQRAVDDDRRHDGSRQLCLLLLELPRYDRHVQRVLLRCAGLWCACCVILAEADRRINKHVLYVRT